MGNIAASVILKRCQKTLHDETGVRWIVGDEMLGWLNAGQQEIQILKPNSFVKAATVKLAAGTLQHLPADGIALFDVPRNMGLDGATPGMAIRIVSREILDAIQPDWHIKNASVTVAHYAYSALAPKVFYVYPPQPVSQQGYVEEIYGASPPDVTSIDSPISVDDIYQNVLADYVLYRCYSKDSEYTADSNRAAFYQNAYVTSLTGKAKVEAGTSPNNTAPANPNVVASNGN